VAANTGAQRNTYGDELVFERKTATTPNPGVRHAVDDHGALSIRQIGIVLSLEPLASRPVIAAESLPPAALEHALEPVDRPTVLEPLDCSGAHLQPSGAGS
jgi:hypothetical protein